MKEAFFCQFGVCVAYTTAFWLALLRKVFLLILLIFILPNFFADKAFAVFLAEPVADFVAAAVTTFMFFRFFLKMLKEGNAQQA